jgi:beta-glucosidase/6-phospho-beta-glucosidase/beta-galactosidase
MWGSGASATQSEGASPASDWWDWERAGHAPPSGDGNGFAGRYAEDFGLLAGLGLRHYRLSIDWARVWPPGHNDLAECARVAQTRGIDVRGLFHWTAVDNYEWLHGYDVPFGIIDRDRHVRASAQVLKREATAS